MKKLFGWIILNYHIAIFLCQIFSVYSAAKSSLVKILVKTDKSQLLCKNFQSKSEFSTSKETIKAHWKNRKSLVSYACPEHCKSLKKCGLPRSSQALDKDQLQWYVTSNIHLLSYFFWICSSNKHFVYNWVNSTCRNKQSLFCNWSKSFEARKFCLLL